MVVFPNLSYSLEETLEDYIEFHEESILYIIGLISLEFQGKVSQPNKLERKVFVEDTKWVVLTTGKESKCIFFWKTNLRYGKTS